MENTLHVCSSFYSLWLATCGLNWIKSHAVGLGKEKIEKNILRLLLVLLFFLLGGWRTHEEWKKKELKWKEKNKGQMGIGGRTRRGEEMNWKERKHKKSKEGAARRGEGGE